MKRATGVAVLLAVWAQSCFDPLYEVDARSWLVCCVQGRLDTCQCSSDSCSYPFRACAAGSCSVSGSCSIGSLDAGAPVDAGTFSDAGTLSDAGTGGGAGGGGAGGGGTVVTQYEACCRDGRIASCECTDGACVAPHFISCSRGRCVVSSATATCPP